jgi:alpha-galactosidase
MINSIYRCSLIIALAFITAARTSAGVDIDSPPQQPMSESPWHAGVNEWLENNVFSQEAAPFSFSYDNVRSHGIGEEWTRSATTEESLDATHHVLIYRHRKTGLEARCHVRVFKKHPAVDWVLRFKNTGLRISPILSDVRALDTRFTSPSNSYTLRHSSGAHEGVDARATDFGPRVKPLPDGSDVEFAPLFGRSSWGDSLPFFNIDLSQRGVIAAIGWTGQWHAKFSRDASSLSVEAGMEKTHLKLYPGEEIRTPRIMLLFWKGHPTYGQNLLRRIVLDHYHPQKNDKPITMPFLTSSAAVYGEAFNATEANQIEFAQKFAGLGLEYLWLDVGWHDVSKGHTHLGPIDRKRFPGGFRSLTDKLRKMGMGLLVWMAPEFLGGHSWIEKEFPELFLTLKDENADKKSPLLRILNYADRDARTLISENAATMVEQEGIGIYRHDGPIGANLKYPQKHPLQWWRDADAPDRQGITEIRYIEGLYYFWDELRQRNPNLIIDLCGGGATRLDIEAMSRCVYLWRSDFNHPGFEPDGHQSLTYGVSSWAPSTGTASGYPDTYSFRSSINNGIALAWNPDQPDTPTKWPLAFPVDQAPPHKLKTVPRKTVDEVERVGYTVSEPFPWEKAKRLIAEFHRIRHFFYGDFYPLTPYSLGKDTWMAYQLHREDLRQGIVLAFRRAESPTPTTRLQLWGLAADASYEVHFEDTGVQQTLKGRELAQGVEISIEKQHSSQLVSYHQLP